ncbi:hypothetical protein J6590_037757 [Homalodisca vitripennis]|nr:hypothetical protein J6590_037757 [Homalodisca vitripennis]
MNISWSVGLFGKFDTHRLLYRNSELTVCLAAGRAVIVGRHVGDVTAPTSKPTATSGSRTVSCLSADSQYVDKNWNRSAGILISTQCNIVICACAARLHNTKTNSIIAKN